MGIVVEGGVKLFKAGAFAVINELQQCVTSVMVPTEDFKTLEAMWSGLSKRYELRGLDPPVMVRRCRLTLG